MREESMITINLVSLLKRAFVLGVAVMVVAPMLHAQQGATGSVNEEIKQIQRRLTDLKIRASKLEEVKSLRQKDAGAFRALLEAQQELENIVESSPLVQAAQEKVRAAEKALKDAKFELERCRKNAQDSQEYRVAATKLEDAKKKQAESAKALEDLVKKKMIELDPEAKRLLDRLSELTKSNKEVQPSP
jgi:DNA repair exonuclease SbcCD ATPase subunit